MYHPHRFFLLFCLNGIFDNFLLMEIHLRKETKDFCNNGMHRKKKMLLVSKKMNCCAKQNWFITCWVVSCYWRSDTLFFEKPKKGLVFSVFYEDEKGKNKAEHSIGRNVTVRSLRLQSLLVFGDWQPSNKKASIISCSTF